jgi:replicative DNA helicase
MKIGRYRWTPEEKREILDALLGDIEVIPVESRVDFVDVFETMDEAQKIVAHKGELIGLSTGYPSLDKMTGGMAPGDLIIIFGDTSHGKSQLAQNITYQVAGMGTPVFFMGLEMTNNQNTARLLGIGGDDIAGLPIFYPKDNDITHANINTIIRQGIQRGAGLVVIDQLQQLTRNIDNLTNELSLVTHEVKRAAVQGRVPIILISHINRTGSKHSAPTLSELKGSSSIEQDADICLSVWRDLDPRLGVSDELQVWLRKNRNHGMEFFTTTMKVVDGVRLVEGLAF